MYMGIQLLRTDDCVSQIIDRHADMVFRLCIVYLKNKADAEDAFQDIFLKVFEKCPSFNDEEHLKAWLIRCTINHCKNILSSFWRRNSAPMDDVLAAVNSTDDREMIGYVMQLPVEYRSVIFLHYFEGYPTKEIASMLKTKDATVRTRLKRGRELLKTNLIKGGFEYAD
jgi:RNA polymerase sigma-70 factor (ECF subfamily)